VIRRLSPLSCNRNIVLLALVAGLLASPARADSHLGDEARTFLAGFHERIDAIVSDADAGPDDKRARVAKELAAHLDYGHLAAAALGKSAEGFSKEQFADFAQEYGVFLTDFFIGSIAASEPEPLKILDVNQQGDRVTLRTAGKARKGFIPGSMRIPRESPEGRVVTYGLRQRRGAWRIQSVSFGGVDTSTTFRGQFESFLRSGTPDALTEELRKRNRAAAEKNPFAS
jgi:ABC-type transporter MlaC component